VENRLETVFGWSIKRGFKLVHFCDCGKHIFASKDKEFGVANLNVVDSSLGGLAPLSDLNEMTTELKESGFNSIKTQKLIVGSTLYGIFAGNA
jgi:hypothetical protein